MQGKMTVLLREIGKALCPYLRSRLAKLNANWWSEMVVPSLTFQQQRAVDQNGITDLDGLDVAALLRTFDQQWFRLSQAIDLKPSDRNYLKEMQTVRNRWAHASLAGIHKDDVYRDLDTIQRFAKLIEADDGFVDAIAETKRELITEAARMQPAAPPPLQAAPPASPAISDTEFQIGQIVALRARPEQTGAVTKVEPAEPEDRYSVFHDGKVATYYASQLQAVTPASPRPEMLPLAEFHARLSSLQIRHPSLTTLYSLNAGKIDYVPYQYRPVLKFIRSDRPRLLIADGVGVGKTIEAELILRELQARGDIQSVLIICPKPLVVERKWERELRRFDERFTHLDGPTLRFCVQEMDLDGEWPERHAKTILPYSLFTEDILHGSSKQRRRHCGLLSLDPPPRFDLIIVDEAHTIRNVNTNAHQAVRFFCEHAEAVVFLTATPIQLGSNDLYVLLNVLRPDLIIDREAFEHMAAPNPFLNRAIASVRAKQEDWQLAAREAMAEAASTSWGRSILQGDPRFQYVYDTLGAENVADEERVSCITTLEQLHTFAGIINRTRRRDIGQFTVRDPHTVQVDFTSPQKALHDAILAIQARIFSEIRGHSNVKFMMTTIRRQAASCLPGLAPLLNEILTRHIDDMSWSEADDAYETIDDTDIQPIEAEIKQVLQAAEKLPEDDPKLGALVEIIHKRQNLSNNKVMVFSGFRHTLRYLHDRLREHQLRVGMVHGETADEDRVALRDRFRLAREDDRALDILLFSEVGCEGLDYEFCDCMVNYDLPWNPMRIEQRIGRIDRRGQKSPQVSIFNLITPGTVDADIYDRCLLRIGVFEHEVGGNEEILGEITKELRIIAEDVSLTPEQQRERLQQLADNKIRLLQEQEALEEKQRELLGLNIPPDQSEQAVQDAASYWLSPTALQNMVARYLVRRCGERQEYILGEKLLKTLRLSLDARKRLLEDFQKLPRDRSPVFRSWEKWLKGGDQHLTITFDPQGAADAADVILINPLHPLVRQASYGLAESKPLVTACKVQRSDLTPGEYPFAIYQWQVRGLREDLRFQAVSTDGGVTDSLMDLLEVAEPMESAEVAAPSDSILNDLDTIHYSLWDSARTQHRDDVSQLVEYRRESLGKSYAARMAVASENVDKATNDNIRRMREYQVRNLEAELQRRTDELNEAITQADITAQMVAYGTICIVKG
ncbi:MAG: Swt1 family HEPN domain-containing protein [Thermoguttaceae bacterium]|jgi:superfamily II DNA or RNA helicase|nr:Swt1 family HEPN domain-containing protein [Thermoguttaceae bacterium]